MVETQEIASGDSRKAESAKPLRLSRRLLPGRIFALVLGLMLGGLWAGGAVQASLLSGLPAEAKETKAKETEETEKTKPGTVLPSPAAAAKRAGRTSFNMERPLPLAVARTPVAGIDHLTRPLRAAATARANDGLLLHLREAKNASVPIGTNNFVGLHGLSGIFNRPSGLADRAPFTGSEMEVTLGQERLNDGSLPDGLEIALQTSYTVTDALFGDNRQTMASGLAVRDVNLGLRVGYSGFMIDALLVQHDSVFVANSIGFEARLSYETGAFAARLSARQYREGLDLIGFDNDYRRFVSFEFGARYRLGDGLGVVGGVQLLRVDDHWLANPALGEKSQMIYLGGSLHF